MDEYKENKSNLEDENFIEVRYEDFVDDPGKVFSTVLDFANLEERKIFQKRLRQYELDNANYKWKENLPEEEKTVLNEVLKDYLQYYGYL